MVKYPYIESTLDDGGYLVYRRIDGRDYRTRKCLSEAEAMRAPAFYDGPISPAPGYIDPDMEWANANGHPRPDRPWGLGGNAR